MLGCSNFVQLFRFRHANSARNWDTGFSSFLKGFRRRPTSECETRAAARSSPPRIEPPSVHRVHETDQRCSRPPAAFALAGSEGKWGQIKIVRGNGGKWGQIKIVALPHVSRPCTSASQPRFFSRFKLHSCSREPVMGVRRIS